MAAPIDFTNAVATGLWPVTSELLFTPEKRPTGPWLHPFSNDAFSIRHHGEAGIIFGEVQFAEDWPYQGEIVYIDRA